MNFSESKKEKKETTPREWISILIFAAAFLIFVAIIILNAVSGAIKSQKIEAKANYVQDEASIVKYQRVEQNDTRTDGQHSTIIWVYYHTYY